MARYAAGTVDCPGSPKSVRIVVVGDKGTGKSSLIVAAASDSFPPNVPPVLPDTNLPLEFFPDGVPVTIVDTSSRPEDREMVAEELRNADAVVLTYDCGRPETLEGLSTYWLPELRRLEVKVPIIVAGCKLDLRDDNSQVSLEQVMSPIMHQFREIETCIECSALKQLQAQEVFYYAQKTVLHPTGPLFDQESQSLKPRCVRALKRIFILCDHDRDGALSEAELNDFQVKCFHAPLQPSEIEGVKRVVQEKLPEGVNERGLTVTGFLFLHALFIEKGRLETTWTVLRKFGYNNDIRLADELLPPSLFKRAPDQSVELTDVAIDFLKGMYVLFVYVYSYVDTIFMKNFLISNEKFLWISFKHIWACFTFTVSTTTVSISHIFSTYVSTTFFSITTITSIVVSTTTSTTPPPRPPSPLWYPQPPLPRPSSSYPHPHVLQKLWQNHPFQKIIPNLHPEIDET